jgi:hypothetical protein
MENQEGSQPKAGLPGNITRVVDMMFNQFVTQNGLSPEDPAYSYSKYVFYSGVTQMYNTWVEALRKDPSLKLTSMISEAIRQDIQAFMVELNDLQKNKVN